MKLDSVVQLDLLNAGERSLGFLVPFCLCLDVWVMANFILVPVPLMVIFLHFKRANSASSPRKEFIEFFALFIRGNLGDFW